RIDILDGGADAGRTQRTEQERHLIAFYKFPGLLHRLGRAVTIVVGDEVDFPSVDTTTLVDRIDVGDQALSGIAERRSGAVKRKSRPYLHLGFSDPRRLRTRRPAGYRCRERRDNYGRSEHVPSPFGDNSVATILPWS